MSDDGQPALSGRAVLDLHDAAPPFAPFDGYVLALLAVGLGWLVRALLTTAFGDGLPTYITFYPAVMAVAILGGRGPGLLATGLIAASVAGLLPPADFTVSRPIDIAGLLLFLSMCVLIIEAMQRYRLSRAKAAAFDAEVAARAARSDFEAALQQSEARYRLLFEQAADGIFMVDADGHYLDVNPAGAQMLGYDRAEILASRLGDFLGPDEVPRVAPTVDQLAGGAVVTSEWRVHRKDGATFCGQVVGRQLPDGRLLGVMRDISAARRVEAERHQERVLLDSIMAGTDVMLVYLDCQFNFVWVNQAYADACKATRDSMPGQNHFALYPDAENEAIFRRVRDTGQPVFFKDKPFSFPDQPERGTTYWDWSLAADTDSHGQVIGLVFSLRETTHYIRAKLAVQESEGRFTALADAAPVLIWMSGPDKRYTWFNRRWLEFTGRPLTEELGDGWMAGIHPDDVERRVGIYARCFDRRQPFSVEYRLRAASGQYRWLSARGAPHFGPDGEFLGYIGSCIDVTERRLIEEALLEAEAFANSTIDAISAQLCVLDRLGRILAVNQAWADFHAAQPDPGYAIGGNYLAVCARPPGSVAGAALAAGIHQVIDGACSKFSHEYPWPGPGETAWFVATVTRFQGDSGNVVVVHENVSERKQAEEAAKTARLAAEQADNAKSRFLAAASHDLRQPLSALTIYLGLLNNNAPASAAPLLANMTNCVASLSELLTDLLDISKLDAGVVTPQLSEFPVADLLTGLLAVHQPEAALKGLRLRTRPTSRYARTDPVLFRRILGNLIANAVRYTEHGGVLVASRCHRGKHWIEVWDSGIGIPEAKLGEVFEEFRQLDDAAHNRGSGLGLAIVAKSAALLGLEVRVCSRLGKGSLFALELPLGAPGQTEHEPEPEFRALHVAVIDDNRLIVDALTGALAGLGHQVTAATSGELLFDRLGTQAPDVVVSDFRLGHGQTGYDVITAARARFGDALPALLITGDTDPALIRSMADRGIVVLHKPLDIATLQASLARLTRRPPA
jgi:PAS domain S-box-containing protein